MRLRYVRKGPVLTHTLTVFRDSAKLLACLIPLYAWCIAAGTTGQTVGLHSIAIVILQKYVKACTQEDRIRKTIYAKGKQILSPMLSMHPALAYQACACQRTAQSFHC